MQRLNRFREDRGAVAVWVALLLIPLMIVAALAVDVSAVNADRQRLQIGADAAALAVAQDCAFGECGDYNGTAQSMATANDPFGSPATGLVTEIDPDGWVEVRTTSDRDYWFAPVIGQDKADMAAVSAASWGSPDRGRSSIPFAFAVCELAAFGVLELDASGNAVGLVESSIGQRFRLEQSKVTNAEACVDKPTSNMYVPGGFGWLAPDLVAGEEPCSVLTQIGEPAPSANGNSQGSHDSACYEALRNAIDAGDADSDYAALLPIFGYADSDSNVKEYLITGYLAITLEGYRFQGNRCYGEDELGGNACGHASEGNGGWIVVEPHRYIASDEDFETGPTAPDLGSVIVSLELPSEG